MTPMEFILRFTFTHPDLDTNIVGTISPGHLQHNVNVLRQGPLPAHVYGGVSGSGGSRVLHGRIDAGDEVRGQGTGRGSGDAVGEFGAVLNA